MNEVALCKAAAAAMSNVMHARHPFDASDVVIVGEGEQSLAERQHKRVLWMR